MFGKEIYVGRRKRLLEEMRATGNDGKRGIAVFLGNVEAPQNYRGNDYKFRQESSFLYFWGIDEPGFGASRPWHRKADSSEWTEPPRTWDSSKLSGQPKLQEGRCIFFRHPGTTIP